MTKSLPQALPGFEGCEVDTPKVEIPQFKYLEIEVTRLQSSIIYVRVPGDFDKSKLHREHGKDSIISKACQKTLSTYDWDDMGWEQDVECQSVKEVSEQVATAYEVYDVGNNP